MSDEYTWNAFLIVRNEEEHIEKVINAIKSQKPVPLKNIFAINDGSTDRTGEILRGMDGVMTTHNAPHPPDLLSPLHGEGRTKLLRMAIKDADYALCMDGDTLIPRTYVKDITGRMRRDNAVLGCGSDPGHRLKMVPESPTVIDAGWLRKFPNAGPAPAAQMPILHLIIHASSTGFRSAMYRDVGITYSRSIGANYSSANIIAHGQSFRRYGFSLWYVIICAIARRKPGYLRGYVTGKARRESNEIRVWAKRWERDRIFARLGMKQTLLKETDTATYVQPLKTLTELARPRHHGTESVNPR